MVKLSTLQSIDGRTDGRYTLRVIFETDDEDITLDDQIAIENSVCLNCQERYQTYHKVLFTKTSKGNVIWWHIQKCPQPIN